MSTCQFKVEDTVKKGSNMLEEVNLIVEFVSSYGYLNRTFCPGQRSIAEHYAENLRFFFR